MYFPEAPHLPCPVLPAACLRLPAPLSLGQPPPTLLLLSNVTALWG